MADDKKTQLGTSAALATGVRAAVTPTTTPAPSTPAPSTPSDAPANNTGEAPGSTQNAAQSAVAAVTSYLPAVEDPLIGRIMADRYLVEKKLGEGGMGAVYRATHRLLEKKVALKVLHGEFARKPDLVERFIQEAKSASRIRHENVIDISDFGVTSDGQVFFAMELLKGHDLHEEIAKARNAGELLPWSRSRPIFLQICAALIAAHGHGIIHRDLKPENIYLVDFLGQPDFVKLLDFGIAKMTEVAEGDRKLTRTGMLFGTPEYMSPEQARGEVADVRVDVYAMACILYQLITGRVPFEADNFMSVLTLHLMEPPPPVPIATLQAVGAPLELAAIIAKGLEKDRNARWQTIAEFASAIRALHGDEPMPGHPGVQGQGRATGAHASVAMPTQGSTDAKAADRWTGSVRVSDELSSTENAVKRSKAPVMAAVAVVLVAGGAAAYFATRPKAVGALPPGASGSALAIASGATVEAVPSGAGSGSAPAPIAVEELPPRVPSSVQVAIVSVPKGAMIFDEKGVQVIKVTPGSTSMVGDATPRVLVAKLKGYKDYFFEVARNRDDKYEVKLEKGSGKSVGVAVVRLGTAPDVGGSGKGIGSGNVAHANGSATVKEPVPAIGSGAEPVKDPKGPTLVKDPKDPPNGITVPDDPDIPVPIKNPFGAGGGSGT
ncbi:MAG: serine/threonine protein kinase [Kofleriaceae bacterium]|nr:serine/threonine protein kinase [Kofleriaceae bacterium]